MEFHQRNPVKECNRVTNPAAFQVPEKPTHFWIESVVCTGVLFGFNKW